MHFCLFSTNHVILQIQLPKVLSKCRNKMSIIKTEQYDLMPEYKQTRQHSVIYFYDSLYICTPNNIQRKPSRYIVKLHFIYIYIKNTYTMHFIIIIRHHDSVIQAFNISIMQVRYLYIYFTEQICHKGFSIVRVDLLYTAPL